MMYLGVPGRVGDLLGEEGAATPRRRASLQLWTTNSFENLSLSHDDSVLQTRTRGRSKLRKNNCLSWLGRNLYHVCSLAGVVLDDGMERIYYSTKLKEFRG